MYILWVLSQQGATRFGALRRQVEGISTKVLTERLRMLQQEGLVLRQCESSLPLQVSYCLTNRGQELFGVLDQLNTLSERWYPELLNENL